MVVVPVYNEGDLAGHSLPAILQQVRRDVHARTPGATVGLLAVDDGSGDDSRRVLRQLSTQHPGISCIGFTRNFGKEAAIHAGLEQALDLYRADVVVVMDADLQHPPELVAAMWAHWCEGARVVEAVKRRRGDEGFLRRTAAALFYGAFSRASGLALWQDTDFKLLDRCAAQAVLQLGERARFFRGIVRWLGFDSVRLDFDVAPRASGQSGWGWWSLAAYAWRNLTAFSAVPLRLVTLAGGVGLLVGFALGLKALWDKLGGTALDGFSTVILLVIIFGSLVLISLGILGSYLARIYDEVKRRPTYVLHPDDAPLR